MRHPSNITCCYSCHATPLASEDGCVLSISSSILSPQARLTSSHLLSPLSPLHIFRQPSQYFFGICIYLPGLDRLQRRLIKFRFQNHSVPIFTAIHKIICIAFPKCVLLFSKREKDTEQGRRKKKEKKQTPTGITLSDNCIIIIIVRAAELSQLLLRSPPDPESPNFEPNPFFAHPTISAKRPRLNCSRPGPGSLAPTGTQVSLWTSNWSVRSLRCLFVLEPRCAHSRFSDLFFSPPLASRPALAPPSFLESSNWAVID